MKDALIINPYDIERTAEAIKRALEMPERNSGLGCSQCGRKLLRTMFIHGLQTFSEACQACRSVLSALNKKSIFSLSFFFYKAIIYFFV